MGGVVAASGTGETRFTDTVRKLSNHNFYSLTGFSCSLQFQTRCPRLNISSGEKVM